MSAAKPAIAVVGHVCLDLFPPFEHEAVALEPGKLIDVGPLLTSTGGAVSNTGLALHRLGVGVRLVGKVGDDALGRQILELFEKHAPALIESMVIARGDTTSYSVVVSPPGQDRTFLHHTGCNASFSDADVDFDRLAGVKMLHFGYPPLMPQIMAERGAALNKIFGEAHRRSMVTSLDMVAIDPASEAANYDWAGFLDHILPQTDLFLPSLDDLALIIEPLDSASPLAQADHAAKQLLTRGAAIVGIKLGEQGLYLRITDDHERLTALQAHLPDAQMHAGMQILSPVYQTQVAGTTGAGDCTIAGLLGGLVRGEAISDAARLACAAGACCVEQPDAVSGVVAWDQVQRRLDQGWTRANCDAPGMGFEADHHGTWIKQFQNGA